MGCEDKQLHYAHTFGRPTAVRQSLLPPRVCLAAVGAAVPLLDRRPLQQTAQTQIRHTQWLREPDQWNKGVMGARRDCKTSTRRRRCNAWVRNACSAMLAAAVGRWHCCGKPCK